MTFDFIELFNAVGASQKVITDDFIPVESFDTVLSEGTTGLDSLDFTLTFMILGEAYGIPEELNSDDDWPVTNLGDLRDFIMENKTQNPEDKYENIKDLMRALG